MQKIIQTRFLSFLIGLFICSSLSAQSYVDISLQQILSPDSVLFCANNKDVAVKVVIKLLDGVSIDSFAVSYQLDNQATVTELVKKRLLPNDTFHYTFTRPLSKDSLVGTQSRLIVTIGVYNSNIDYSVNNNIQSIILRKSTPKALPYTMNFEGTTTPPLDWTGIKLNYYTSGYGAYVKEYVPDLDSQNGNSLAFQAYNLPLGNTLVVKSPVFDLSNIDLPYLYLNRAYGNGGLDTFKIDITKDCGDTYQPLFRKGGSDLWTMETFRRDPYNREHWRRDSFNLQAFVGEKVQFRFTYTPKTNDILYLDEVTVANRLVLNKDLLLVRHVLPDDKPICPSDKKQTPVELVIKNNGATTTDTIQLAFRVNNGNWVRETLVKRLNLDDSLRYTFTQLMQIPDTGAVLLTLAIG